MHSPPDCQVPALTVFACSSLLRCGFGSSPAMLVGLLGSRMHLDSLIRPLAVEAGKPQLLFFGCKKIDPGAGHLRATQANLTEWGLQQPQLATCSDIFPETLAPQCNRTSASLTEAPVSPEGPLAMWGDKLLFSYL